MAAGFGKIVNINGYNFHDVTDETTGAFHVMSYEEAYAYTLGYRPYKYTITNWSPPKERKEKSHENS